MVCFLIKAGMSKSLSLVTRWGTGDTRPPEGTCTCSVASVIRAEAGAFTLLTDSDAREDR